MGWEKNVRHQRNGNGQEEQRNRGEEPGKRGTQPAAQRQEAREESDNLKEERDQEEHPSKPPHIPVIRRRGITAMVAHQR